MTGNSVERKTTLKKYCRRILSDEKDLSPGDYLPT